MMTTQNPNHTPAQANAISITELNQRVAKLLERQIPVLWVQGEVSNFTRASSGHWYFSLKDHGAQVRAVMFRHKNAALSWQPREGDAVLAFVAVGLYAPRGDFQLTIESMRPAGQGSLFEQFERHKRDLAQAGLFEAAHKKPLPTFIRTLGIITSPQAAALRDVVSTLARRAPHISLHLFPCLVQGEAAAEQIANAIDHANHRADCDALLLIRGGGSIEDLWAFNEPLLAHAIFNSRLPIISGVGHETDTTIADFVADVRAATPTAAAELASSPSANDWLAHVEQKQHQLHRALLRHLNTAEQHLDYARLRLLTPASQWHRHQQAISHLCQRLNQSLRHNLRNMAQTTAHTALRLQRNPPPLGSYANSLEQRQQRLHSAATRFLATTAQQVGFKTQQLTDLGPAHVLARGYAYVQTQSGDIVYNADALQVGEVVHVQFANSQLTAAVVDKADTANGISHTEPSLPSLASDTD